MNRKNFRVTLLLKHIRKKSLKKTKENKKKKKVEKENEGSKIMVSNRKLVLSVRFVINRTVE